MIALWSTAYGPIGGVPRSAVAKVELPCEESVWLADTEEQWRPLYSSMKPPLYISDGLDMLLSGCVCPCSGLSSLALLVNLMLNLEELQETRSMSCTALNAYFEPATACWAQSHDANQAENAAINFIVYPLLGFVRTCLTVDVKQAMACFLDYDFDGMTHKLRNGDLISAGREALSGLVPWCVLRRNQSSMVAIPCGKSSPFACNKTVPTN